MIPAADLSEQISTAGRLLQSKYEARINGAYHWVPRWRERGDWRRSRRRQHLHLRQHVEQVDATRVKGYNPYDYYNSNWELKALSIGCDRTISHLASRMLLRHFVAAGSKGATSFSVSPTMPTTCALRKQ